LDETYAKVGPVAVRVYQALEEDGQVIDVYVSARRDTAAARRFFTNALTTHGRPDENHFPVQRGAER
jgi:transposase-like protein